MEGQVLGPLEMNELLKRFTYKPGWSFQVLDTFYSQVNFTMLVSYPAKDAFNPDHDIIVGARRPFRVPANEQMFWSQLLAVCDYMERHEAREWFKVDGEMPFNPHKEQVA